MWVFSFQNYIIPQLEDVPGVAASLYMQLTALLKNDYKGISTLTAITTATKLSWTLAGLLSCMEIQQLLERTHNNVS